MIYTFGEFRLDCDRFELQRAGRALRLERKPMELLILFASREDDLIGRAEIAAHLWGSEVFVDTEHGINTAVRKIRQALRDDPDNPRFVHTVLGRGYRFTGPVTVLLPHGPPPEPVAPQALPSPAPKEKPRARSGLRSWLPIAAALALIATAVILRLVHSTHTRSATEAIRSLAVLPLDNLSGDPREDYYAAGMTDELTTMLARDSTLRIVSRTSAAQYKDTHHPLADISRALSVDAVIEGSVERSGGNVHMNLQLIHAPTDTHLWAQSYDRTVNGAVTLPEEAAQAIAKRLNSAVLPAHPNRYVSAAAHDAYLQGKFRWYTSPDGGGAYFRKAIELQTDYANAWSGLAIYYASGSGSTLDPRAVYGPMEQAARKAVSLDDSLPEAHLAMAAVYYLADWNFSAAERETLRALELDPQYSEGRHFHAKLLAALNRHAEAIAEQKKATELDPFSRTRALALSYQLARQYDNALTDLEQRLSAAPNDSALLGTLADVYRCKGMKQESVEARERYFTAIADPDAARDLRRINSTGGYDAVLRWQIGRLETRLAPTAAPQTGYVSRVELAGLYAQLGRRDRALDLLAQGVRNHEQQALDIQNDPAFDVLHADSRYRALIRTIGLPPAW